MFKQSSRSTWLYKLLNYGVRPRFSTGTSDMFHVTPRQIDSYSEQHHCKETQKL